MKVCADTAYKAFGKAVSFEFKRRMEPIKFSGMLVHMTEPVVVQGVYKEESSDIQVQGKLKTVVLRNCDRCTNDFESSVELEFCEIFYKGEHDEDREGYAFQGDWIDLTEMIESLIVMSLPIQSLCKADCQGLCSICGCDLNISKCDCQTVQPEGSVHSEFSKLKALLQDDKEV